MTRLVRSMRLWRIRNFGYAVRPPAAPDRVMSDVEAARLRRMALERLPRRQRAYSLGTHLFAVAIVALAVRLVTLLLPLFTTGILHR